MLAQQVAVGGLTAYIVLAHGAEVAMRLKHCLGIGEIELRHKHREGERVVKPPDEQLAAPLPQWQVLVEQQQVVAEIEIGLAGIAGRQTAATEVIDHAIGHKTDVEPEQMYAPA